MTESIIELKFLRIRIVHLVDKTDQYLFSLILEQVKFYSLWPMLKRSNRKRPVNSQKTIFLQC